MTDVSVKGLTKAFEVDKNILDGLSFDITAGERVGILGRNGAGKTTLFKLMTGEMKEDEGDIVIPAGRRLGLVSQIPVFPAGYTVEDVLKSAFHRVERARSEMERLETLMASGEAGESELRRYGELGQIIDAAGGYDADTETNKVANGLDISQKLRAQLFSELSGGEQTRVNLARLILENTDILLLDEPTNHLDMNAVEWLEEYLKKFKGTVLAISHDRYFLDRVVTRIIEIVGGKAEFYSGNYSFYVTEKQRRFDEKMKQYEKNQAKIAQLTQAADKLHLWAFMGNDKLHKRAFSMEKRIERLDTVDRPTSEKQLRARFSEREFRADEVMVIDGLKKSFGEKQLLSDVSLLVLGGERIGIIGDNGTGKTTFVRMILGLETADAGKIKLGPAVKCAYLPQQVVFENPERSLLDTLIYDLDLSPQSARNRLGAFLFSGDDVLKPVSTLSGGERSRLKLCMLMNDDVNLLILDEPTNHLDIASREWMEHALEDYGGALMFISHDRYFISRFATRIWELEGGAITDFRGSFEQYRAAKQTAVKVERVQKKAEKKPKPKREKSPEKQLAAVETQIERAEAEKTALETEAEQKATDYEALLELGGRIDEIKTQLEELYQRWEELAQTIEE